MTEIHDVILDGTYPYDAREGWEKVAHIPRELATKMLGVPHFKEHDNGFLNKGYVVVAVDAVEKTTLAVYHDGKFSIIRTSDEDVMNRALDEHGAEVTTKGYYEGEDECPKCLIPKTRSDECPHCPDEGEEDVEPTNRGN